MNQVSNINSEDSSIFSKLKLVNFLSTLILISILICGVFKYWIIAVFANLIGFIIQIESDFTLSIINIFNSKASIDEWKEIKIGWLLYYPMYLSLHIMFIHALYRNNKKAKKLLSLVLIITVLTLIITRLLFMQFHFDFGAQIARRLFDNLFGLPFILLMIEGGRILYNDMQKLT